MRLINRITAAVLLLFATAGFRASAQDPVRFGGAVELDRTVYDFGDVLIKDGPVSCTFNVKNVGSKPLTIFIVQSSCGCTDVTWTKGQIQPGGKGSISATYSNDEGAYPFDKTLTAYFSDLPKPIILRFRGVAREKAVSLDESYPILFGDLGLKSIVIKAGNMSQGQQKSGEVMVANTGSKPLKLEFQNVHKDLKLKVFPNPIPAGKTARLSYTVSSDRELFGFNCYKATPVVNGKAETEASSGKDHFCVRAFTKESFPDYTEEEKKNKPNPILTNGATYDFGKVKAGTKITAGFTIKNTGKEDFHILKADCDTPKTDLSSLSSGVVPTGGSVTFKVKADTSKSRPGEYSALITLTTDSPSSPIMTLFISGIIE